jgi:hypothetical protein
LLLNLLYKLNGIKFLTFQIQVVQDDQRNRSGIFFTNHKGLVPPLVTTNFLTQDQGNASPRYIRSSMYNVPATIDMMKQVRTLTQIEFNVEDL